MKFLIRFGVLIGLWYFLYTFFIKPSFFYDSFIIDKLTRASSFMLNSMGFETILVEGRLEGFFNGVKLPESNGVSVGPECDGLIVISLFVCFIVSFPGKLIKKLWYIPLGAVSIFLLNAIRISVLAYIVKESPEWLDFNHDYTFTIIIYGYVFFLWYLWVDKMSKS